MRLRNSVSVIYKVSALTVVSLPVSSVVVTFDCFLPCITDSSIELDSDAVAAREPYSENKNHNNNNINNQTEIENPEYTNYSQDEKAYTSLKLLTTLSKDYKLLVKVTSKGEVKPYKSGKGKLFSFIIMDELGNKMQAVAFGEIVDKFKDEIIENEIYEISGGYIRTSDKRYDPPGSDYKLILTESTTIIKKDDEEKNS